MTIGELAGITGVSAATVSRVFANHTGINPEVRGRVLEAARKHGYHPRVSGRHRNVVIITPCNSVYPVQSCVDMLLTALTQALPAGGFRAEILPVNNLERLNAIPFCGAAAIGCEPAEFKGWNDRFASPLVLVDRAPEEKAENVYSVRSDEAQGMTLALDHLFARGCRKIGCIIHGDPGTGNTGAREKAVRNWFRTHELEENGMITFSGPGEDRYVELTGKLLKRGADALFCPGGNAGIVMMYALSLYGKRVPEDVSLIASEQTFYSKHAVPPQTTITQDYAGVASAAEKVISDRMNNVKVPVSTVLPYRLILRESVRAL